MTAPSSQYSPNADDQKRIGHILHRVIIALLATYAVVAVSFVQWDDLRAIAVTVVNGAWLLAALALLPRGHVTASGALVVANVLLTATILATIGQGVHDIGLAAFPAIVVVSALVLPYRAFLVSSAATIGAVAWLVFGEMLGLYTEQPVGLPSPTDFVIVGVIMMVTILATSLLANHMRQSLHLARQENERRQIVEAQLRHTSTHDALTGIYNRMHFEAELQRLEQSGAFPVSIIVADVDNLKTVNDTQGHAVGDEILRRAAVILRTSFRSRDVLARIGGDEFAVLLPQTDAETASQMLARIENERAEFNRRVPGLPAQFSLGVSTAVQGKLAEALVLADQCMYANKAEHHAGRAPLAG